MHQSDETPQAQERQRIVGYVERETHGERVTLAELHSSDDLYGMSFDTWNVVTDTDSYWVLTDPTNLYSQSKFSADEALTFHLGLHMRMTSPYGDIVLKTAVPVPETLTERLVIDIAIPEWNTLSDEEIDEACETADDFMEDLFREVWARLNDAKLKNCEISYYRK